MRQERNGTHLKELGDSLEGWSLAYRVILSSPWPGCTEKDSDSLRDSEGLASGPVQGAPTGQLVRNIFTPAHRNLVVVK